MRRTCVAFVAYSDLAHAYTPSLLYMAGVAPLTSVRLGERRCWRTLRILGSGRSFWYEQGVSSATTTPRLARLSLVLSMLSRWLILWVFLGRQQHVDVDTAEIAALEEQIRPPPPLYNFPHVSSKTDFPHV